MRKSSIMGDDQGHILNESGESIFPLLMGFFLFWLWIAEDFPFFDKMIMTSLIFGLEFVLALGLNQPPRKMDSRNLS